MDHFQNLIVRNEGQPTRLCAPGANISAIDVTIISSNLVNKSSWSVLEDTYGSDHYPISIELNSDQNGNPLASGLFRWQTNKEADWNRYHDLLENVDDGDPSDCADSILKNITANIVRVADIVFQRKKARGHTSKKNAPPWWDQDCSKIANERKETFKLYKRRKTLVNFIKCKELIAKSKRMFKLKARESWSQFCDGLNAQTNPTVVWKRINSIQRGTSQNGNNTMPLDQAETFIKKLSPDSVSFSFPKSNLVEHFLLREICLDELNANLKCDGDTSPGMDGISYSMIANLPQRLKLLLCTAFNKILRYGETCDSIKHVLIIPINKQNKPNEFRAISLMSCLLKTFERVVKRRLEWWLETRDIFPYSQFGFRRGKGVMDCIAHLTLDIQQAYTNNQYLACLFLDIASAYDNVNLHILVDKMAELNIPPQFSLNLVRIFHNRRIYMHVDNTVLGPRQSNMGLPQGSVLSPLLFNVYTLDLHSRIYHSRILQYADDFCLYSQKKSLSECQTYLRDVAIHCKNYFTDNGFDITPSKSAIVIYTRRRLNYLDTITLGGMKIPWCHSYKYLGMVLDQKLTWNEHINNIQSKAEKSLNMLKVSTRRDWGADFSIAMTFYKAYTRSLIDFGCMFYGSATNTRLQKLDRLQFKAMRLVTGAYRSTPTNALLVECNELPLSTRRTLLSQKFIIKCQSLANEYLLEKINKLAIANLTCNYWIHKNSPPLAVAFTETADLHADCYKTKNLPFFNTEYDISIIKLNIVFPQYSEIPSLNNKITCQVINRFPRSCEIYTDGSKTRENKVGCAYWIPSISYCKKFKCDENVSIFSAEATAIEKALEFALTEKISQHYLILTDSFSVLQAVSSKNKSMYRNPLIKNILEKILFLQQLNMNVAFIWVKGHGNIPGNEKADLLAKEACRDGIRLKGTPYYDINSVLQHNCREVWRSAYESYAISNPCHYTKINKTLNNKSIFERTRRRQLVSLARVIFGHANINSMLFKMKITDSPNCSYDEEYDDLNHWIFRCKRNEIATKSLLRQLGDHCLLPLDSVSLLNSVKENPEIFEIFLKFLSMCQRKL